MSGNYTLEDLRKDVAEGRIDTVLACQVDMQGRLMGKRFHAQFLSTARGKRPTAATTCWRPTSRWRPSPVIIHQLGSGYGDYTMKPDLSTLRRIPWLEGTALVLCDMLDHHTHKDVPHSPRAILKKQVARLEAMGLKAFMATELEFFLFDQSYDDARESGYRDLKLVSGYNEDYHIFQTTKKRT